MARTTRWRDDSCATGSMVTRAGVHVHAGEEVPRETVPDEDEGQDEGADAAQGHAKDTQPRTGEAEE